jgi:hypothetical protein
VRLLLEAQADLTCTDGDGDTAATNARKAGRLDVVELLHQEERRRIDIGRQKPGESEVGATARASGSSGTEVAATTEAVEAPPDGHPSLNACRRAAIAVDNRSAEEAEAWLDEHIDDADIDAPIRGDATRAIVEHLRKLRYEEEEEDEEGEHGKGGDREEEKAETPEAHAAREAEEARAAEAALEKAMTVEVRLKFAQIEREKDEAAERAAKRLAQLSDDAADKILLEAFYSRPKIAFDFTDEKTVATVVQRWAAAEEILEAMEADARQKRREAGQRELARLHGRQATERFEAQRAAEKAAAKQRHEEQQAAAEKAAAEREATTRAAVEEAAAKKAAVEQAAAAREAERKALDEVKAKIRADIKLAASEKEQRVAAAERAAEEKAAEKAEEAAAAAEKAAAEKATAEKVVAEKALAMRAAEDKAAMKRAAAVEKAWSERAAAERAAEEEKVVAERAALKASMAADKAAADKAAAKKAASEKAASEKAVAEMAAFEKTKSDKAAVLKAAAEDAAAARTPSAGRGGSAVADVEEQMRSTAARMASGTSSRPGSASVRRDAASTTNYAKVIAQANLVLGASDASVAKAAEDAKGAPRRGTRAQQPAQQPPQQPPQHPPQQPLQPPPQQTPQQNPTATTQAPQARGGARATVRIDEEELVRERRTKTKKGGSGRVLLGTQPVAVGAVGDEGGAVAIPATEDAVSATERPRTAERTSAAEYYGARGHRDRGGRTDQRATSRWEAFDAEGGSGSESDPEEELEQLRRQVRERVRATSNRSGAGIGVAALERRLRGERDNGVGDEDD